MLLQLTTIWYCEDRMILLKGCVSQLSMKNTTVDE